ncbi:uncharacterized protein N7487_011812 [Penicillium crustosum]|uniref:uncharacterized protein n=1 Tax=Penicillium crustosum TaxID=36656 RepID=UPI002382A667|nr:uncharacterized protein N7487_011812 [Penicillium crustosum]KAJ5394171.1 hypothetical protein N7487_011812 [Penicillium crustosum]
MGDNAAAEISPQFYKNLIEQATDGQWPRKDVACAIHDALQKYRTTRSEDVISWSSPIHMGANE